MRKITSLAILGLMWLASSAAFADDHGYVNGICTMHDDCDEHFERPLQDADGFYMLYNAGNVEWISQQVADNNLYLDCKLMNDIDFENIENLHSPIGPNDGRKYNATFDGQGHRIKNMIINRPDTERQGFFGDLRGNPNDRGEGTVIKNLIIDKSCSITGGLRTGGITGTGQNNAKEIIIMNCVNEASITTTSKNAGGITGGSTSNHPIWKIINCVNTGTITALGNDAGEKESAGISGWLGNNANTRVTNCFNLGMVDGLDPDGRGFFRFDAGQSLPATNCYDISGNEDAFQCIDHDFTAEDVVNGRLAYSLNSVAGEIVFWQTLGEDEYPVPFSTSKQVYLQGELLCDGTPIEGGTYTNDPVEPVRPPHEFVEGDWYCVNCGAINENFCEKDENDFYQLNNELDVCWFAEFVKAGNTTVNAKLNADLDFTDYPDFAGIADRNHGFKGIFDGGFHTISNMDMSWRVDEDWVGFINFLNGGATVKNLRGDATCVICAHGNAGFIGGSTEAGDIHLENLGFEGDVSCQRAGAGGVLGCNTGSVAIIYMTNCYSTGFISGSEVMENGALSAWLGGSGAVITNCWSSATVSGVQNDDKYLARFNSATFNNCYSLNGTPLQAALFDEEELENGSLCYKLNGNQEEIAWFQTLGADEFPTFMPGHEQVYANGEMRCDGALIGDITYSNTQGSTKPDHQFVDGFCSVCHQQDPDYPFLEVFANADHDTSEGYTTSNSGDGSGLAINNSVAEHWNMQWFETYQDITGLEPGLYRLRLQGLQRVQAWDADNGGNEGDAYEMGVLSDAYAPLYHSSQYFAEINGKKVAIRFKDIAEDAQEDRVNETEVFNGFTSKWAPNSLAACNKYFARGLYWNEPLYFAIESEEDSVKIGVENSLYLYGNWTVWDTWRLDKIDGDIDLIRQQQEEAIQHELEDLEPQVSLKEAYNEAKDAIANASTLEEIMAVSDVLARTPNLIRRSHLAYEAYKEAIDALREEREGRDDLNGPAAELFDSYLEEDVEPSEDLPNGSYLNIIDNRTLSEEELTAELAFARQLYENAIMTSITEGSDVSNIIKNAGFDEDDSFKDWVTVRTYESSVGYNFSCNTGFPDIYPVAGSWNTAFNVSQYIVADIPDGIYELEAPAFYRPGGNLEGDVLGNDYVPADLFINDFYTPIMNIYAGRVLYEDAQNGVNGRFDPNDPNIPHAGEATDSYEFDTGVDGYVPEKRQACSFAFAGGRYVNNVYGIVQGGTLTLGIRNTGKPWYESGMTMWGKFKLTYRGYSEEAIAAMMDNFQKRLDALKWGHEEQWLVFISQSHIDNLETYIADAQQAGSLEEQLAAIKKINDEFNTVLDSYDAYNDLLALYEYCGGKADELIDTNPEMSEAFVAVSDEIYDHYMSGDLTDEEARNYRQQVLNDPALGGGYYVQGDLLDAEGNELDYGTRNNVYPMTQQEDGTFVAPCVYVQNRANLASGNARAGIYVSRMDERYECQHSSRRFITPAINTFKMVLDDNDNHNDFQTVGGQYKVTYNPADSTIVFDLIGEYPWHNNVYVVGSIMKVNGEQHRWKNDEMAPLAHKGNGVYSGTVEFFRDPNENLYPNFTIFSCRSNTGAIEHSTATRSGWNEGRYGSETNKLLLENGVVVGDLIRGSDRKWYMNWDETKEGETQEFLITFDMNHATIKVGGLRGDVNCDGTVDIADAVSVLNAMAGQQVAGDADVNADGTIDIADLVTVLNIMAGQ